MKTADGAAAGFCFGGVGDAASNGDGYEQHSQAQHRVELPSQLPQQSLHDYLHDHPQKFFVFVWIMNEKSRIYTNIHGERIKGRERKEY